MLGEERLEKIKTLVNEKQSVSIQELMDYLNISESTIRRDLTALDLRGDIVKVYGGAMAVTTKTHDDDISQRQILFSEEKKLIGMYAANLIKNDDFIYIDAGTTTECIIEFIKPSNAVFVTNAVTHARKLSEKGFEVHLVGGKLKPSTQAIVGSSAAEFISNYNFTKGFWGTNGINRAVGFTTPDPEEAAVKRLSMTHCKERYIVADFSKFGAISPVKFSDFKNATIITNKADTVYSDCNNIIVV